MRVFRVSFVVSLPAADPRFDVRRSEYDEDALEEALCAEIEEHRLGIHEMEEIGEEDR